jgi:hypothetical protein
MMFSRNSLIMRAFSAFAAHSSDQFRNSFFGVTIAVSQFKEYLFGRKDKTLELTRVCNGSIWIRC